MKDEWVETLNLREKVIFIKKHMMTLSNFVSSVHVVVHEQDQKYDNPSLEVATSLAGESPEKKLVIF